MTNSKTTKRALFSSVVALLLCFTMLLGTTFAWFTDSASSATNKIVAGNLDVELYHADKAQSTDAAVDSNTKLFDDVTLWEPGAIVWEKLTVKNAGSLALKYNLSVNVTDISSVGGKSLADVLKVAVLTEQPTRENVASAATQSLATFNLKSDKALTAGNSDVVYVAIYWAPSANDNNYNMAGQALYANLGVTLVATQYTSESDSFDNQYDRDATYDGSVNPGTPNPPAGITVINEAELLAAIANASTDEANPTVISIANNFDVSEAIAIPAGTYVEINGNGKTISRAADSTNVSTGSVVSAINAMFYIEGNASITNLTIDAEGDNTNRLRGVVVKGNVDLTGCTITGAYTPSNAGGAVAAVGGTVNLDNCTITGNTAKTGAAAVGDAAGTVNIKNSTISNNIGTTGGGKSLYGYGGSAINISNSTITGDSAMYLVGMVGGTPGLTYTISGDVAIDGIYNANNNASHRDTSTGVATFEPLPAIRVTSALEKDLVFYVNDSSTIIRRTLLEGANGYTLTDADLAHVKVYFKDGVTATDYTLYDASNATYELVVQDNRIEFVQK